MQQTLYTHLCTPGDCNCLHNYVNAVQNGRIIIIIIIIIIINIIVAVTIAAVTVSVIIIMINIIKQNKRMIMTNLRENAIN